MLNSRYRTILFLDKIELVGKGGSAVYVHNSITSAVIETFEAPDSLAIQLDLVSCKLIIVCVYRSQSLTHAENCKIIEQINELDLNANTELFIVGDFNLPDALWDYGSVNCPVGTVDSKFLVQMMFMEFFQYKGFHWMLNDGKVSQGESFMEIHFRNLIWIKYLSPTQTSAAVLRLFLAWRV